MAKMPNMNERKKRTLTRPGIDIRSVCIKLLISGNEFIDLSGLRILKVRSAFKAPASKKGSQPMTEMITMNRSRGCWRRWRLPLEYGPALKGPAHYISAAEFVFDQLFEVFV